MSSSWGIHSGWTANKEFDLQPGGPLNVYSMRTPCVGPWWHNWHRCFIKILNNSIPMSQWVLQSLILSGTGMISSSTDSFSFQHSFVHFLHHFLLSSCIAALHAIYRQLTPFLLCNSLELQRHQQLQSLTPLTHILSHSHWSVHLLSSINTAELTVVCISLASSH